MKIVHYFQLFALLQVASLQSFAHGNLGFESISKLKFNASYKLKSSSEIGACKDSAQFQISDEKLVTNILPTLDNFQQGSIPIQSSDWITATKSVEANTDTIVSISTFENLGQKTEAIDTLKFEVGPSYYVKSIYLIRTIRLLFKENGRVEDERSQVSAIICFYTGGQ